MHQAMLALGAAALCAATAALPRAGATSPAAKSSATNESGATLTIRDWTLPNGLRVVYAPVHRLPAVTVQVWYHVGSKNEQPGLRGVAHMFEHMMFKGSARVPPERHAQLLAGIGGEVNAFTAEDVTAYHNTLPRQYFSFAVALEAERMRHLLLTERTIASEREVVKEEKRLRLENSPIGRALEALRALAYRAHPYAWSPAGDIPDLDRVTVPLCQRFYDTYYRPNNATLVIVGDVGEEEVRRTALTYFGPIAGGAPAPPVKAVEPPQAGLRERRADWPSQLNVVLGAYHIPDARHADLPALTVLATILGAGRSSRLHQALVRRGQLALGAGAFAEENEHPGLFVVYGYGLPTQDLARMQQTLLEQVDAIAHDGVTAAELEKARNQLATGHLRSRQTVDGLAYQIGVSTYLQGDPRAFLDDVARIDRVTAADVRRVAGAYLQRPNLSLVALPAQTPAAEAAK
ncbi:MAG: insulinase family protein [Proteobacteria bacterium]|nr:insulinase family protein [Pseudomonadota bacterium]